MSPSVKQSIGLEAYHAIIILISQDLAQNIFGIILRGKVKLPWRATTRCAEIIQIKMQRPRIEIAMQISSFSLTSTSLRILGISKVKIANSVILSKAIIAAQENSDQWCFTILLVKIGHVSLNQLLIPIKLIQTQHQGSLHEIGQTSSKETQKIQLIKFTKEQHIYWELESIE